MISAEEMGKRIKKAREQKGMTQEELANEVYVQKQAVSNWENGKNRPTEDIREILKHVLGIDFLDIPKNKGKIPEDLKPLNQIKDIDTLFAAEEYLISLLEIDSVYEKSVRKLVRMSLDIILGYEVYFKIEERVEHGGEEYLNWEDVAYDICDVLDRRRLDPIPRDSKYPLLFNTDLLVIKLKWMGFIVGAKLEEDFDDNGYLNGYVQQIGRYSQDEAGDLVNIYPLIENDITTAYRIALYDLYYMLRGTWGLLVDD